MVKTPDKQLQWAKNYLKNFDEIKIRIPKEGDLKDKIKAHADSRGESVNGFINRAISETMERDNTPLHINLTMQELTPEEIREMAEKIKHSKVIGDTEERDKGE